MPSSLLFLLLALLPAVSWAADALPISSELAKVLDERYPENVADLRLLQSQVEKIATQAVAATVEIEVGHSIGSGVLISPEGLVLTAAHVIGGPNRPATVVLADGRRLKGHTLGAHHPMDAGMVQLEEVPEDLPYVPLAQDEKVEVGSWVVATGQPGGILDDRSPPIRLGRILAQGGEWICTDCTLVGGDSGGPLFNMQGEVLAIHMSIGMQAEHNFHVPVAMIRPNWEELVEGKVWGRGFADLDNEGERVMLGIAGRDVAGRCLVTQVFPGFPAAKSGLKPGDIIHSANATTIKSLDELNRLVLAKDPGDRVELEILRGDKPMKFKVRLGLIAEALPGTLNTSARETNQRGEEELQVNYPQERITVPSWRFAHGPHVRAAFRDVVAEAREAVVKVHVNDRKVALGGIVNANGGILTKASALNGTITCRLADGRELPAELVGVSREFDLALLKVNAQDLPTLKISSETAPIVGSWLASVGMDSYPVEVGVVSVEPRVIPHQAGILGVQLDSETGDARIVRIFPGSAAAKAGMLINDVIVEIDGAATPSREALIKRVQQFSPGDTVKLLVDRGGKELELTAVLMGRFPGLRPTRNEFQNSLGSELSERRFGFASAFQHDTVIEPTDVGGPAVNLDGDVVGFNVARSGRTETYAIAADSIVKVIEELTAPKATNP